MKLSICLATYNGEKYIEKQVKSILQQIGPNDEIIVSDDGSVDKTISILKSFGDARILLVSNKSTGNPAHNFENAIIHSTGDIIFLSDQDDIWLEHKVEKTLEVFKNQNPLVLVSDAIIMNEDGKVIVNSYFKLRNSGPGFLHNLYKNSFLGCTMAFHTAAKKFILPLPNKVPMHDEWIGLICSLNGRVIFLKDQLIMYRRHGDNVTNMHRNSWLKVFEKRIRLIHLLTLRQIKIVFTSNSSA